jgi:predicted small lipoprotein YifL
MSSQGRIGMGELPPPLYSPPRVGKIMPVRTLIIVLLAVAAIAGCGRRGSLEAPGAAPSTSSAAPTSNVSPLDPGSVPATPEQRPIEPQQRRFFLDFLL